ncbi:MAG: M28 family peptidase [Gemmatimonas sp.]
MYGKPAFITSAALLALLGSSAFAQGRGAAADSTPDPVKEMVGRLDLEKYKATIKGLTQFGDRRQGTKRNRDAVDWIEAQLKSYGCTNTERVKYNYPAQAVSAAFIAAGATGDAGPPATAAAVAAAAGRLNGAGGRAGGAGAAAGAGGRAGAAGAGAGAAAAGAAGAGAAGANAAGGGRGGQARIPTGAVIPDGRGSLAAQGGGKLRGIRTQTGVNADSLKQTDLKLRALNSEPAVNGPREMVFCTKVGSTHPEEMYIVGAHMDGHGWGEAANDDGSGTAIVMELARIMNSPDVTTERSIRFALWNNEETGLNAAKAYVEQRQALQGIENPAGSGKYPEPKWLGMIQHDMMMFDHGMPRADGSLNPEQRPEADVNIEFQINSKMSDASMKLAFQVHNANTKYATVYPAQVGPHMTNTDSDPFKDITATISLRENERGREIGAGWDPHWHQVTDMYKTFSDKDFMLGMNAAQTTLGAVATFTGAKLKKIQ